jgi:hypothetical protein
MAEVDTFKAVGHLKLSIPGCGYLRPVVYADLYISLWDFRFQTGHRQFALGYHPDAP